MSAIMKGTDVIGGLIPPVKAEDVAYGSETVKDALDSSANKVDIATVESGSTASRAYSVGELVYVNSNLYKVITAIASGATFTVGTNIQSTNVSGTVKDALDDLSSSKVKYGSYTLTESITVPANGFATLTPNLGKAIVGCIFSNYNTPDINHVLLQGIRWYSSYGIQGYNPTSASITIPEGMPIIYAYAV